MPADDLARFCCQNPDCDWYGCRGEDNLLVIDHSGKAHHRLLYCRHGKARFSELRGTPFFNSRLSRDKVLAVLEHLAEGCGVAQTARLVGVNKDTVTRLALLAGRHAKDTLDELMAFSPETPQLQFDGRWAFVARKQRNCDPDDPDDVNRGDARDFVAYDPEHRLVVAVIPGARTAENAEAIVAEAERRLGEKAPDLITTDELDTYKTAIEASSSEPAPIPRRRGPVAHEYYPNAGCPRA